ncbi:uncharacterized protein LOC120785151 [Xiphias gladius]|uniref:uncharacterized protein LOC120785151 n=1 Tax=Xiphias gladius TaxID=8245 RepID=UPI001A98D214|nr:uncharacterized protein LOC120785151 [Xiphias gladius]
MLQQFPSAPVSSVLLVSECLSQGEMKVSCSSEGGDSPQYSWTLDGRTLTDAELLSGNHETNNITLKQDVSGRLVCSVRNSVSSVSEVESISSCGFIFINCTLSNGTHISKWVLAASNTLCIEPTTAPTTITNPTKSKETGITVSVKPSTKIATSSQTVTSSGRGDSWYIDPSLLICGLQAAVAVLSITGIAVYFAWKKKKYKKAAVPRTMAYPENSVLMVEMRSSAPEL